MTFAIRRYVHLFGAALASVAVTATMDFLDNVIVGHYLGETALAGLGLFSSAANVVEAVSLLVAGGTVILHAEAMGSFDRARANAVFSAGCVLSVFAGVFCAGLLAVSGPAYLALVGVEGPTMAEALAYWRAYIPSAALMPVQMLLIMMVMEDGGEVLCAGGSFAVLAVNATVSFLLCRVCGIAGCAYGTLTGMSLFILILLTHFRSASCSLACGRGFRLSQVGRLLLANIGDAGVSFCLAVTTFVANGFIVRRFGSEMLPVATLVFAVDGLFMMFDAFSKAAQPIVGVYFGERNFKVLRAFVWRVLTVVSASGLVVSLALLFWPGAVVGLLDIDEPGMVVPAMRAVRIVAGSYVFSAVVYFLNSYYAFIGEIRCTAVLTTLRVLVMPIVCFVLGGWLFGFDGFWAGFALAAPLSLAVFFGGFLLTRCRKMLPFFLPQDRDAALYGWNLVLTPEAIAETAEEVEARLKTATVPAEARLRAPVVTEEVLVTVMERNAPQRVRAEVLLDLNDGVEIVERDDGVVFDITDADAKFRSFGAYFVTNAMDAIKSRSNLTTTGINRNRLCFGVRTDSREEKGEGEMEIIRKEDGQRIVLALVGRLNTVTAPALEKAIEGLPGTVKDLAFDFSRLDYTSSAGLRITVAAKEIMDDRGGTFVVVGANEQVKEAFGIAQLLSFIDFR